MQYVKTEKFQFPRTMDISIHEKLLQNLQI